MSQERWSNGYCSPQSSLWTEMKNSRLIALRIKQQAQMKWTKEK